MEATGSTGEAGRRVVTVGYDGSARSRQAVDWAVAEAAVVPTTVRIVACYSPPPVVGEPWAGVPQYDIEQRRTGAELELERVAAAVAQQHPNLTVETAAVLGAPGERLMAEAEHADLLVVGTAGHGMVDAWRLGSVAHAAVRHAACPVVLVPGAPHAETYDRVVVGVDGSAAAGGALAWAADEADARDAELVVVHVWLYPYATEVDSAAGRDLTRVDAALVLDAAVERVRARQRGLVRGELLEGVPGATLAELSGSADLVVVGSRGRSIVRSMLFGSVAHSVSAHATCPTVVIRDADGTDAGVTDAGVTAP